MASASDRTCTVLSPGQGEAWWAVGDHITFKLPGSATNGAMAVAETVVAPGGGPPPHVHLREDETFFMLEGTVGFILGDKTTTAGPGEALFLPRGTTHAFKNIGDTPAKFLVIATPGGFDKFIAEWGEPVAKCPKNPGVSPEVIGKLMATAPRYGLEIRPEWQATAGALPSRKAPPKRWVMGHCVSLDLIGHHTAGQFCLCQITSAPGAGVPPHVHRREDEIFYVIDGTWEFTLERRRTHAPPGTFIHVPSGIFHGFQNVGQTPGKLLDLHTPGGFEAFFEEVGTECTAGSEPPKEMMDVERLTKVFRKHGMELAK